MACGTLVHGPREVERVDGSNVVGEESVSGLDSALGRVLVDVLDELVHLNEGSEPVVVALTFEFVSPARSRKETTYASRWAKSSPNGISSLLWR